jgi:predicted dehydrogenase
MIRISSRASRLPRRHHGRVSNHLRWGVLGTGGIATAFVQDLRLLGDHEAVAVGSRTPARAEAFARRLGLRHGHGSYDALVADPEVDVVYVATPHPAHAADALLALEAGKPVLVEKPFTVNSAEAAAVTAAARRCGLFCMEAMWTRFLPHMVLALDAVRGGRLGSIRTVIADHGQRFLPPDPTSRLYAPELAGGALLDLGVYPVSFAHSVLGEPAAIISAAAFTDTGVDAQSSAILSYDGGAHAVLTTTLGARTPTTASITGTEGRIELDGPFYRPGGYTLRLLDGTVERWDDPQPGNGLRFQAAEVERCLREGLTQSPTMTWDQSVAVVRTMDTIRRQIGLRYPFE